ncbi:MAG: glycosyltransferase family 4 protein [Bryobacterales bacterium]|nr:glycosyltransferase family 4 protein [Bryobacterales bacterium]
MNELVQPVVDAAVPGADCVATVVLSAPRVTSSHFDPAFEPLNGVSVLRHLLLRLERGLAKHCESFFVVVPHDKQAYARFAKECEGTLFQTLHCESVVQLEVLGELCRRIPRVRTLLIYPELAVFQDVGAVPAMLAEHAAAHAHASSAQRVPPGLLPVIVEASAISELAAVELPSECSNDVLGLIDIANRLFPGDFHFNLHSHDYSAARGISASSLPSSLLLNDSRRRSAAAAVAAQADSLSEPSYRHAQLLKALLIRADPPAPVRRISRVDAPMPVLFTSYVGGLSGAEASWAALISRLDRSLFRPLVLLPAPSALSSRLEAGGVPVQFADWDFTRVTPASLQFFTGLLQSNRIALVDVNGHAGLPVLIAAQRLKIPIVTHIRIFDSLVMQDLLRFSDAIVTVSQAVAEDVLRCDLDPVRVLPVYNGVDLNEFQPGRPAKDEARAAFGIPRTSEVIAFVARVHPDKRYDLLLDALAILREIRPNLVALCVGEAYPEQQVLLRQLKTRAEQAGIQDAVYWAGFRSDIQSVYAASDVLVACNPSEPLARCTIEACAMGVPSIAPSSGGSVEIVRHLRNGLLFEPGSADSLAQAIHSLLEDPVLRQRLAAGALETASQFSIESHVRSMSAIFDRLVGLPDSRLQAAV